MNNKEISEIIRKGRLEKGYSQSELAEIMGVKQSSASRWENGEGMPIVDFVRLIKILGIAKDILSGTEEILETPENSPTKNTEGINYVDYLNLKMEFGILQRELDKYKNNYDNVLSKLEQVLEGFERMDKDITAIKKEIGMNETAK